MSIVAAKRETGRLCNIERTQIATDAREVVESHPGLNELPHEIHDWYSVKACHEFFIDNLAQETLAWHL